MSYCKTSYETSVGKIFNMKELDRTLREALITGGLISRSFGVEKVGTQKAVFVIGGSADENQIPPFIHPYLIENFKGEDILVTDIRLFRTTNQEYISEREFESAVRNKTEYALSKARAILSLLWLDPSECEKLRSRFQFAGTVYASWLSQAITRAYALDFQDQTKITALGIYFYHTLFSKENQLTERALETAVIHTIKATKLPAQEVYALFESLGEVGNIEAYCVNVQKVVENIRLKDFSLAMLLTLVKNTWYGTNAKDLLSVALEHPPTWIAIVFSTLTERGYKGSTLFKVIEFSARRGNSDEFRMNFLELLKSSAVALESLNEELIFPEFE
jgi:hypothetical protein